MAEASWQPFKSNLLFVSAYQCDYKMIKSEIIENLFRSVCFDIKRNYIPALKLR